MFFPSFLGEADLAFGFILLVGFFLLSSEWKRLTRGDGRSEGGREEEEGGGGGGGVLAYSCGDLEELFSGVCFCGRGWVIGFFLSFFFFS